MKNKVAVFFLLVLSSLTGFSQSDFVIRGSIAGADGRKLYLSRSPGTPALDSTTISDKSFLLTGKVYEADLYTLQVEGKAGYARFILSNARISFDGHADSLPAARIRGSRELADAGKLHSRIRSLLNDQARFTDSTSAAYSRGDRVKGKQWEKRKIAGTAFVHEAIARFIIEHPNSLVSLLQLSELHVMFGPVRSKQLFGSLAPFLQRHSLGKQLQSQILHAAHLASLNSRNIPFSQPDTSGRPVMLGEYKGQYLLIDFWASWCRPCRTESPYLRKAFARFGSRGFGILSVSLDNNRQDWLSAIRQDHLTWQHVSDLRGFNNAAARQYGVTELPTNYLLDPSGKIIDYNLRGERLERKLQELMGD